MSEKDNYAGLGSGPDVFSDQVWEKRGGLARLESPWVTILAERWRDNNGCDLDYWRVERPDSVIVLPVYRAQLIMPPPSYRPGIGRVTWDFPGGRKQPNIAVLETAKNILQKELGIHQSAVQRVEPVNDRGWPVDSSFSSQRLWGVVAHVADDVELKREFLGCSIPCQGRSIMHLMREIDCLQCRMVLVEWWLNKSQGFRDEGDTS
ncbi:NUDIX hydrolase [Acidithiobacillus ferrooxidans]|uniref:hypothetical protein n=1 Tax=Acidithiobacillus ferrooxidans TaxID=920 RepID=UPI001C066CE1|nr:hypothetical protein [Acidithiobacillus ferrooxidans]MBU2858403.1 NUDIX hydrolase [Acidithiobacillus ferrooxidans]MCR2830695.1 hypothetical protein [Acidithiobacillus ferrooxidans]